MVGIFRELMYLIDGLVYWLVETAYVLFFKIAEVDLSTGLGQTVTDLFSRISNLTAVAMLFYLTFVLLQWLVNPDKMTTDGSKLIKRAVISASLLLVLNPVIFPFMKVVQEEIIAGNTIQKIIVGVDTSSGSSDVAAEEEAATSFASTVLGAFIVEKNNTACHDYFTSSDPNVRIFGRSGSYATDYGKLNEKDCLKEKTGDDFSIDYTLLLSTIVGGYLAYLLVLFCIDIGTRVVELAFLQIVAPVPVLSYIVKDGSDSAFSKWTGRLLTTYFSLFLRMAIFSFGTFILQMLMEARTTDTILADSTWGTWAFIFIVLGVMTFMKQAPQLVKDVFGLKGESISFSGKDRPLAAAVGVGMAATKAIPGVAAMAGAAGLGVARQGAGLVGGVAGGINAKRSGGGFWGGFTQGSARTKQGVDNLKTSVPQALGGLGAQMKAMPGAASEYFKAVTNAQASGSSAKASRVQGRAAMSTVLRNANAQGRANATPITTSGMFKSGFATTRNAIFGENGKGGMVQAVKGYYGRKK